MLWKYRQVIAVFLFASIASFFLVYLALNDVFQRDWLLLPSMQKPQQILSEITDEAVVKFHYLACRHTVAGTLPPGVDISGLDAAQVRTLLPPEDGWVVEDNGQALAVTRFLQGFCPEDESKTHLGAVDEYVAVFQGPVGINTQILQVTDIPVRHLPADWQEQLKQGELDFDSVKNLKETLDSLDEYSLQEY